MDMSKAFIFIIIMLSFLVMGCAGYQASTDRTPLGINADRTNYTPLMSSTVGIGLTPEYSDAIDNGTVSFRWQADYGYFVSWKAPDFKVNQLGPDVATDDGKIYWSYSPDDMDKEKLPVRVTLTMVDKATGKAINTTGLDIGWENRDMARVKSD